MCDDSIWKDEKCHKMFNKRFKKPYFIIIENAEEKNNHWKKKPNFFIPKIDAVRWDFVYDSNKDILKQVNAHGICIQCYIHMTIYASLSLSLSSYTYHDVMKKNRWRTQLIYCSAWVWHAIKTVFLFFIIAIIISISIITDNTHTHVVYNAFTMSTLFREQLSYDTIYVWYGQILWWNHFLRNVLDDTVFSFVDRLFHLFFSHF